MSDLFAASQPTKRKGMGGHHSPVSKTEVWLTPPHVLKALGRIDLDPCACMDPRPWSTADVHYTRADNGLTKSWRGHRVFMNPPYGGPAIVTPWLQRMAEHRRGTALIFARTETEAFHAYVWQVAHSVLFLRGRLFFHRPDGTKAARNAGAPSCLIAYGCADSEILETCGLPGQFVRLRDV
jgi:hypothetical protein